MCAAFLYPIRVAYLCPLCAVLLGMLIAAPAAAQPYLSDLEVRADDPLFATYAAPLDRSQFIIDEGYHFRYYEPGQGADFITDSAGSLGLAFEKDGEVRYTVRSMHEPPVVTMSYSDLVRYRLQPFEDVNVDIHFQVYSSRLALQDVRVTNDRDVSIRISVIPFLAHGVDDVRVSDDRRAFAFRHVEEPDGWTKSHDVPYVTDLENVYLISEAPDAFGAYAAVDQEATVQLFADLEQGELNESLPSADVGVVAFQKTLVLGPGDTKMLRTVRGVADARDPDGLREDAEEVASYTVQRGIEANEELYARIPKLHFEDPDHEATYWNAFSLMRQVMLPPEGESSYNYYVFSREPTWGWGHGGQVFHESLTMMAYAFMDPESALNSQRVYMERQHDDGYINYRTGSYLNEVILTEGERTSSAPWYNWINWELYRQTGDREFLVDAYESGKAFYEWWLRNRDQDGDGLAEWGAHAVLESVRDGKVAVWDDVGWPSNFEAVDLNSMLVKEARSLAAMARALGDSVEAARWTRDADKRAKAINDTFWDEETGFYYNADREDHDFSYDEPDDLKRQEIIGFLPLWAGISNAEQTARLVEHLTNPSTFWRPNGVPSLSADDPYFEPLGYWNGPIWVEWQYLIFRGLLEAGYMDEAAELADRVIDHVAHHLKVSHTFWELYSPDELEAGHHQTYIWTGLVARMMLDLRDIELGLAKPSDARTGSRREADGAQRHSYVERGEPVERANQELILDTSDGLYAAGYRIGSDERKFVMQAPLFTLLVNDTPYSSAHGEVTKKNADVVELRFDNGLTATVTPVHLRPPRPEISPGWQARIQIANTSGDTLQLENIVPFGASDNHPYITASGPWSLARTKLYRPGDSPIGVILPDNAWEMGYASIPLEDGRSVAAIARRRESAKAERTRWHTRLEPGGNVTYAMYTDLFEGPWQNGLRLMFRDRYLYDLEAFDETLYKREDLKWIRDAYVAVLQAAWDREFFDREAGRYVFDEFLSEGERLLGGYDVYAIWPTWPRLGLDPRNQWDLYRDLPGGLPKLNDLADYARANGTRFFISYNPWDQSTRTEDPYRGMASLIEQIGVDGVVLDTRGSSSYELQAAADSVRGGVVMYSEGMAVPKDMPGIISGRVHDAILVPPPLNLNKLIRPEFAIFRVAQLAHETVHRDVATSFFNGYGVEINTFRPSRPPNTRDDYLFLGEAARILRTNSDAFHSREWTPLIDSKRDSIWVNEFPGDEKTLYAIYSLEPSGHSGPLFRIDGHEGRHFVDLWHHREIEPDTLPEGLYLPVDVDGFDAQLLHTQDEGVIGAVAALPRILEAELREDTLHVESSRGDLLRIWAGNPSYQSTPHELAAGKHDVVLYDVFGPYQGKFVVELFQGERLLDERIVTMDPGTARLIESSDDETMARSGLASNQTRPASRRAAADLSADRTASTERGAADAPPGMVFIPAATVAPELEGNGANGTGIMHYPTRLARGQPHHVDAFYIDRYPITNAQYQEFLEASDYTPSDPANFLRHWKGDEIPAGLEDHPVVNVSLEDARAYARWAGKRLPTELEWQLAAQGTDGRNWPWGDTFDSTRVNVEKGGTTPVDAFPEGESPYGVRDLVGNVWQLTSDVYSEGDYRFVMIRGGSFYNPTSSWWYMKNGPRPLNTHQVLLLVSPGFDRSPTVGFRLAADVERK